MIRWHIAPRFTKRSVVPLQGNTKMATVAQTLPVPGEEVTDSLDRRKRIIAIVGASSGNLVEWYDFYTYAFTSIYFASAFFPSGNPTSQLLATAGIFAVGFFMRPLGGCRAVQRSLDAFV